MSNYKNIVNKENSLNRGNGNQIDGEGNNFNSIKKPVDVNGEFTGHSNNQAQQIVMRHRSNIRNILGNENQNRNQSIPNDRAVVGNLVSNVQLKGPQKRVLGAHAYNGNGGGSQMKMY